MINRQASIVTEIYRPESEVITSPDSSVGSVDDDSLTEKNWRTYAARRYTNPQQIGDEEFDQDMKRLKYIKKAVTRYKTTGELCERIILNHMIVLVNVVGPAAASRLIFLKMPAYLDVVKPFLIMLKILPKEMTVNGVRHVTDSIAMDENVVSRLRRI